MKTSVILKKWNQLPKHPHQILVKDACIIIDLIELNLLRGFLTLNYDVITTSAVIIEITDLNQKNELEESLNSGKILVDDNGSLIDIMALQAKYSGLSYADASVLEVALRKQVMLITADGLLRKAAVNENNTVHGTLWVIETLHYNRIISVQTAIGKIKELMQINKRISPEICFTVIKRIEEEETTYHINK